MGKMEYSDKDAAALKLKNVQCSNCRYVKTGSKGQPLYDHIDCKLFDEKPLNVLLRGGECKRFKND